MEINLLQVGELYTTKMIFWEVNKKAALGTWEYYSAKEFKKDLVVKTVLFLKKEKIPPENGTMKFDFVCYLFLHKNELCWSGHCPSEIDEKLFVNRISRE